MTFEIQKKQHVVFGAGLIGCYLGGVLTSIGAPCLLVCRPYVQKRLAEGLTLTDYLDHQIELYDIQTTSVNQNLTNPVKAKYLWLTMKCVDVQSSLDAMRPFIDDSTIIFYCQNGFGVEEMIKATFPNQLVLRVIVPFNVVEIDYGHYHRGSEGALTFENNKTCQNEIQTLAEFMNSPLLSVKVCADMQVLAWAKLQLNLSNAVCALADVPVKTMLEQKAYRHVIAMLMEELLRVLEKEQVQLPQLTAIPAKLIPYVLRLPDFIFKRLANSMLAIDPTVRSSMWWDVKRSKVTEIDYLNGVVVALGDKHGVDCHANRKVVELIKLLEPSYEKLIDHVPPIEAKTLLKMVKEK